MKDDISYFLQAGGPDYVPGKYCIQNVHAQGKLNLQHYYSTL